MPAYFVGSETVGCAYTGTRGSLFASMMSINVFDMRWSSRVLKLSDQLLLKTPSPGHSITALSAFDLNTPPGAANAFCSSDAAVAASTLMRRSAMRARSVLENRCHDAGSPP